MTTTEEEEYNHFPKAEERIDVDASFFEAKVRYLASSQIVTIPVRVSRELNLALGDRVIVKVQKKDDVINRALKTTSTI